MEPDSQPRVESTPVKRRKPLRKRPVFWVFLGLVGIAVALGAMLTAMLPLSSDTLRHRIVRTLSEKLDSDVELGDLHLSIWPTMRAEGSNLTIRRRGGDTDVPPLIAIKTFHVDTSLVGLAHKHVDHVKLEGLDITIPPKAERQDQDERQQERKALRDPAPRPVATSGGDADSASARRQDPMHDGGVVIDRVDAIDTRLIIVPSEQDKEPKVWAIHALRMNKLGAPESWPFEATLTNAVPPGEIAVKGGFGPWHRDDPGDTPLNGRFTFDKADLSVFKGISGMLSSKGQFSGTLEKIVAEGETETPDFVITVGGHPFPLRTKYHSTIDGTNGNTWLDRIDAWFLHSYMQAKGAVIDAPKGRQGRTVTLDIDMQQARIEDIMVMAVHTPKPPMTGALRLQTKFVLPPGDNDVSQRLRLDGHFQIAKTRFTNFDVQGKINELSKRGKGDAEDPQTSNVVSDFQSRFRLGGGRLELPNLTFAVPGAKVELAGDYALKPETLDFKGQLVLDGMVSDMVTGWKKWVMRPADSVFRKAKKDGKGSLIPIKIGGTRNEPKFGLDVRGLLKRRG